MTELQFADEVLDRLQERHPRFDARSYIFVLQALHSVIKSLEEPRHVSGKELSEGVKRLALDRFGPMARTVLEHWGIHDTDDVGRVVFAMVEQGILIKQDGDQLKDFTDIFDFEEVFELRYNWEAQS